MAYETNPAGIGVDQHYGVEKTGVTGVLNTLGKEVEVVFEITPTNLDHPFVHTLPAGYSVTDITLDVEDEYTTGTADLSIDGGAGLTTDMALDAKSFGKVDMAGLANTSDIDSVDLVMTFPVAVTGEGYARVIITYKR